MKSKLLVLGIVLLLLVCCATEKSSWEKAKKENTTAAYKDFQEKYPKSSFKQEATARLAFLSVVELNTVKNYEWFLKLYSKSKDLADEALARLEKLYIDEALKQGSITPYEEFLKKYPQGNIAGGKNQNLEKLYFQDIKKETSIVKLETFLKRFPRGQFSSEVLKMLETSYFEDAESRDSVVFYHDFIKRYPASTLVEKARARIEELYNQRHPALRQAKTVKINIDASFPGLVPPGIEEAAMKLMEITGLEIVGSETQEPDTWLTVKIEGEGLKASYSDGSQRYTGAKVSGSIRFSNKTTNIISQNFSATSDPAFTTPKDQMQANPADAPFLSALAGYNSFAARLLEITAVIFGRSIYQSAMKIDNHLIQHQTAYTLLRMWENNDTWAMDLLKSQIDKAGDSFAFVVLEKLKKENNKHALDVVLAALNNSDPNVKSSAIHALGYMKPKGAAVRLISILEGESYFLSSSAARALGRINDPQGISTLINVLVTTKFPMLQKDIAEVLGQYNDPRVIKPLIDLLDSQYHYVRDEAARSLAKVTGENYGQQKSKWLEWWSKNHKR
jgi:outer membrane protein assembly factor BamD (BamD/ComL family)